MPATYAYPIVPVANFISSFLVLIPLPWLLQHWNTGAWTHALWSSLMCFINGVNTVIWAFDTRITAVTWCDITIRVAHAGSLAIVTTNFVMARRLCLILNIRSPISQSQKRRANLFDLFFCIGVPILSTALSWFVQGHRFTIWEGSGCAFAYYNTPVFIGLYYAWLPIFAILSAVYGCIVLWSLARRRNAMREVVAVDPEISFEQFRRVIALGCAECFITLPLTLYIFIESIQAGVFPWKGLADAHWGFSDIRQVPVSMFDKRTHFVTQWNNWVTVFSALVFFLFFGLSRAMWSDYRNAVQSFARRSGIKWLVKLSGDRSGPKFNGVDPPMIFKIRTTLQAAVTRGYSINTSQLSSSIRESHAEDTCNSSVCEAKERDIEKGVDTVTVGLPDREETEPPMNQVIQVQQ